ncbi:MAG: hypothetical protein GXP35_14995 [Actinobacteria bacterium]|nr:hypothetical protein [Actinomycetota bacterium]
MTNPTPELDTSRTDGPRSAQPSRLHRLQWKIVLAVGLVMAMVATAGAVVARTGDQQQAAGKVEGVAVTSPGQGQGQSPGQGDPDAIDKPLLIAGVDDGAAGVVTGSGLVEPERGVEPIEDVVVVNDAGAGEAEGDLTISLGAGALTLTDANVAVSQDSAGDYTQVDSGTATLELPTVGVLSDTFIDRPLRGAIGMATGAELAHIGAHLSPEKLYLYADLGSQPFNLFLDLEDTFEGAAGLPEQVSTVGLGGSALFIADIEGDYFYLSVPCEAMLPTGQGSGSRTKQDNQYADDDSSLIPNISLDLSSFDPGGCGLGWSAAGAIPFTPLANERIVDFPDDFTAHLVIDGTIPVHPAASLDAETFYNFGPESASIWANGELDIGVPMLKGAVEISLPAARGTFGMVASDDSFQLWVTANIGEGAQEGELLELLTELSPISGRLDLDGELHIIDDEVQSDSFFQLSGNLRLGLGPLEALSGGDLDDIANVEAIVRIDATGVAINGSARLSPVSILDVVGTAQVELLVPFADPAESFFTMEGQLEIGLVDLGVQAALRIDKNGVVARGDLALGSMAAIAIEGKAGPDGFQLTGSAEATLPIGDLDKVAANLVDATANEEVIRRINLQVDERIGQIAGGDAAKATELRNTFRDFRSAYDTIGQARTNIAYNDALIANLWADHQADIDWHWALNDFDRFWDKGPHALRLGAILAQMEPLKIANSVQYGYIDVANLVVSGTQQGVIAIIGWDEDLNTLMSLQSEAYAKTLGGNFVATVLNGADAILDAFGIDGSAHGVVEFTVGTEGIGATAYLDWCRDGSCERLAGATIDLTDTPRLCGTFLGVENCVNL